MRIVTQEELGKILIKHTKWLENQKGGERANLSFANLRSADLSYADLRSANLSYADLSSANLSSADLRSANLSYADLSSANLRSADLSYANLSSADLRYANLRSADLSYADLSSADLRYADLSSANLSSADLCSANLRSADLNYANLSSANLSFANLSSAKANEHTSFYHLCCPEEGDFVGWKKCHGNVIVKLLITGKRSSATTRKCRCSEAKVLAICSENGEALKSATSIWDNNFKYIVGETVKVDNFDEDRWHECSTGIHFFLTRAEAKTYLL